ncbi:hypothetical protein BamIOP4010DRAFT_3628 [Burkholderia ambifaria IOP40-10]|uniref:Uncharacterized protein n=1 Tax=Burkholderia ambifaria IOP40-10 TaxID=396596 RepID=B1FHW8_9BURK|nr:hypothetical protein [Burkholderia ambifaria]EDT02839.1 hypothetical protein BamIOP4010DRAFT_3628 [Burkholderia ambifaria IOP40-10]
MNPTRMDSVRRLDAWCTRDAGYSHPDVTHSEIRSQILEAACRAQQLGRQGQIGRLEFLAGGVFWGRLYLRDDLTRVANRIGDSGLSSENRNRLIKVAGYKVRQAQAEVTASLGLALEVARARVMRGAPCGSTALEHGLTCSSEERVANPRKAFRFDRARNWIQKYAVRGVAGGRVERGESCSIVAAEHEIDLPEALAELESRAIRSVAQAMVDRGDTFRKIVNALGIRLVGSKASLQDMIDERAMDQSG